MSSKISPGYYNSNTKDCDVFCVKGTEQEGQKFYFRKDAVMYQAGADVKWSLTNKQTFDNCITVTDSATVETGVDGGFQYKDMGGRGFYLSANLHYGDTVKVKTQWAYHDSNGDSISAWGAVTEGAGGNVSGCVGVWYDKDGDLHIKFGLSGVIPECPGFGVAIDISKKTQKEVSGDVNSAGDDISHQVDKLGSDVTSLGNDILHIKDPF
jgi:hypothetical protein